MTDIVERIVELGGTKKLVGIASLPTARAGRPPAIIILNTGIIHRVGNHRLSVTMARQMARWGHLVLRFDLAGLGDSANPEESIDPIIAALTDIQDAVDWVTRQGVDRVILMGLCAGADRSIFYAGRDPRVAGAILLDPSIPRTRRFHVVGIKRRCAQLVTKVGLLGLPAWAWRRAHKKPTEITDAEMFMFPDFGVPSVRGFYEDSYRAAIVAGQHICALFTSGFEHAYNYREQLIDAFPTIAFGSQLQLHYLIGVDHNFTLEHHRALLLETIGDWLSTTNFSHPAPAPQPAEADGDDEMLLAPALQRD